MTQASTHLHVILARNAPYAVVLRRGPTKQVALIGWSTADDSFEVGQWLKGRIYEERCDLSPNGRYFVYFAGHNRDAGTWTAISRPPYLTALAFWPLGDTWGGGGTFVSDRVVAIEAWSGTPARGELPPNMKLAPQGPLRGDALRLRDGWTRAQDDEPWSLAKARPIDKSRFVLHRMRASGPPRSSASRFDYELVHAKAEHARRFERLDWADWDRTGDLLFAKDGRLFRLKLDDKRGAWTEAKELADFRTLKFAQKKAPEQALRW